MIARDPLLELLRKKLRERMDEYSNNMIEGVCGDFADYRYHTGVIRGYAEAERCLLDLDDMQNKASDEEVGY